MPAGRRTAEIEFDFVDHNLVVRTSDGATRALALVPRSVAEFYREFVEILRALDLHVALWPHPVEIADGVPFPEDTRHAAYDAEAVGRWWRIVRQLDVLLKQFRGGFVGKCSPVHFFWGSFDLCVTRFSGRPAPARPGADRITRLAYDQEVSSVGFWPGGGPLQAPALYSYTSPEPPGFAQAKVRPRQAFYSAEIKEFVLLYDDVRRADRPEEAVLEFAQSTYEAGASLAGWNRAALEWTPPRVQH
jgi:hypothetical protein